MRDAPVAALIGASTDSAIQPAIRIALSPARRFWQFEKGGVEGVRSHPVSGPLLRAALPALGYAGSSDSVWVHGSIAHNDVLAAVCARLLLKPTPGPCP